MSNNLKFSSMKTNVQITAVSKEFKNGKSGFEVKVEGMDNKLQCSMNFTSPLKAMRYMFLLAKRLELQMDTIQLTALSLAYHRAKEAEQKAVEDANAILEEVSAEEQESSEEEPEEVPEPVQPVVEQPAPESESLKLLSQQFNALKARHPEAVLIFRQGDSYELYMEDANVAHEVLGLEVSMLNESTPMATFPHHALDTFLPQLIRAGKRVAICDPIHEAPKAKRGRKPKKEVA